MLFLNHYKYISHHFSANFHLISWALNIESFILVLSVWCVIVKKLSKSFIYHLKSNVSDKSWILNRVFCVLGRTSNEFWYLSGIKAEKKRGCIRRCRNFNSTDTFSYANICCSFPCSFRIAINSVLNYLQYKWNIFNYIVTF